jgi:DNA (cytosine-5)-methyltransferase 1
MENVGGLLSPRGKQFLNHLNERCRKAGYFLTIAKLNSFDFGVPQIRKRVFIVGELTQNVFPRFSLPKGIKNRITFPSTVRQAIEDLILKTETEIPNHKADKLSAINLARIRSIEEGEGRESLPPELQLNCHNNNAGHRHLDVYGRLAWDLPSPTITARFDSFSRGRFGHPILDRTITLREGARLQSFPDDFVFSGTKVQVAQQIGNAVPPLLALALAESIKTALE